MKSHAEAVFPVSALRALRIAEAAARAIPSDQYGCAPRTETLYRCHEIARIVFSLLDDPDAVLVDGTYCGVMPHSWIYVGAGAPGVRNLILDPYAVGQLPQVRLVEMGFGLGQHYKYGPLRTDIRIDVIEELLGFFADNPIDL